VATVDVSFISLTLVLPPIAAVLPATSPIVALVKPQFEAGRDEVGRGGVVLGAARAKAIEKVLDWARTAGYALVQQLDSPIPGPRGNVEHLVLLETPATEG
jgi:23S rRNA (cytidine1920-2'-O)/16S rRNA (cytidine1409-2'-O)-methyltransferase